MAVATENAVVELQGLVLGEFQWVVEEEGGVDVVAWAGAAVPGRGMARKTASSGANGPEGKNPPCAVYCGVTWRESRSAAPARMKATMVAISCIVVRLFRQHLAY